MIENTFRGKLRIAHTNERMTSGCYVSDFKSIWIWNDCMRGYYQNPNIKKMLFLCETTIANTQYILPLHIKNYNEIFKRYGYCVKDIEDREIIVKRTKASKTPSLNDIVMVYKNGEIMYITDIVNETYVLSSNKPKSESNLLDAKRGDFKIISEEDVSDVFELVYENTLYFKFIDTIIINDKPHAIEIFTNKDFDNDIHPLNYFEDPNVEILIIMPYDIVINDALAKAMIENPMTLRNDFTQNKPIYCCNRELQQSLNEKLSFDVSYMGINENIQHIECGTDIIVFEHRNGKKPLPEKIIWKAGNYTMLDMILHCCSYNLPVIC